MVLVGPTHPYTGGIAQHTTRLALELESRGRAVRVESWRAQYPRFLYKGPVQVPDGKPEIGVPKNVVEKLAWYSPLSWWLAGRRSAGATIGLNIPTPFHAIPYLVFLAAAGAGRVVAIVHNVLPHEPGPADKILMKLLLRRCNLVIVHNEQASSAAVRLGVSKENIQVVSLPSPWPAKATVRTEKQPHTNDVLRLLFFGTIRKYKGLDILLKALARTENAVLTIAGEFWEDESSYRQQIVNAGLSERVTIRPGYAREADFSQIFGQADVLVLPYRSGTGSIVRELGFQFGLPVIATSVGSIAEGIEDDVTGLVIDPEDSEALAEAIKHAQSESTLPRWRKGVLQRSDTQRKKWDEYVTAFLGGSARL